MIYGKVLSMRWLDLRRGFFAPATLVMSFALSTVACQAPPNSKKEGPSEGDTTDEDEMSSQAADSGQSSQGASTAFDVSSSDLGSTMQNTSPVTSSGDPATSSTATPSDSASTTSATSASTSMSSTDSGTGTSEPIKDRDKDGIPDDSDPFPDDGAFPGRVSGNVVYAHTAGELFKMDPFTYNVTSVGTFVLEGQNEEITDIAIDRYGVLYAITHHRLMVCHPQTAKCRFLAKLPSQFNGLTLVPPGTLLAEQDALVGISADGSWYHVTVANQQASLRRIGSYGIGMSSAGDVFSIRGEGTFASINRVGQTGANVVVRCDPKTGAVQSDVAVTTGYNGLFGLAGWANGIFGFNVGGQIISISPKTGEVKLIKTTEHAWYGAGVYTVIPVG